MAKIQVLTRRHSKNSGDIQYYQLILGESPNTILTNKWTVERSGERTIQPMSCIPRRLMNSFSGVFLVSISLLESDLEYFLKNKNVDI